MLDRSPVEVDVDSFADTLQSLTALSPAGIERFGASIPAEWIEDALASTGTASIRRRKLPAEQAIWLVLGMALFSDRSIRDLVDHLDLVMPGTKSLAPSAISQARGRIGPKPLEWLFNRVAAQWSNVGGEAGFAGMSLFALDGTCMRVQDSEANYEHFGKPTNAAGEAGYPQLRMVCLMNLGTRMLVAARFGPYASSELDLAADLWMKVPSNSITIVDRGFVDYRELASFVDPTEERHLLVRIRDDLRPEEIEELPDGTLKVRMLPTHHVLKQTPLVAPEILGRVIAYQHPDGKGGRLFTTLLDPERYPAKAIIELYHARWEIELAYDELKTHMLDRKECLRCKSPARVEQELWGLLLVYNLVRREMLLVAVTNQLPPARISFLSSLLWIANFWVMASQTSPANVPKHLGEFHSKLKVLFLPERRTERRYPRHVKIRISAYPSNRGKRPSPNAESLK